MTLKNSQELAQAREIVAAADERARLAREMHDSLGKTLYGISLSAAGLESLVFGDPDRAAACASDISDAAVQAANESRQLLLRLRDRKSTRLNSSHVAISYAVFCLKK